MKTFEERALYAALVTFAIAAAIATAIAAPVFFVATWIDSLVDVQKAAVVAPLVPQFAAKQCYVKHGERESWQPEVDGQVVYVGKTKYLVMPFAEADRKFARAKIGFEEEIRTFDQGHRAVLCPITWRKHRE